MLFFSRYLHFCVFDDTTQSLSRHPLTETFFQTFDDFETFFQTFDDFETFFQTFDDFETFFQTFDDFDKTVF